MENVENSKDIGNFKEVLDFIKDHLYVNIPINYYYTINSIKTDRVNFVVHFDNFDNKDIFEVVTYFMKQKKRVCRRKNDIF